MGGGSFPRRAFPAEANRSWGPEHPQEKSPEWKARIMSHFSPLSLFPHLQDGKLYGCAPWIMQFSSVKWGPNSQVQSMGDIILI